MKLYIDDLRNPKSLGYNVVRSYAEAIHYMTKNGCPKYISFDHDLGDDDLGSGYDIAKWMVQKDLDTNGNFIPDDFDYNVHSANPVGVANIVGLFGNYLKVRK